MKNTDKNTTNDIPIAGTELTDEEIQVIWGGLTTGQRSTYRSSTIDYDIALVITSSDIPN